MEEKIKIYIPKSIYNILLKDMELFEFYKKDRSLNRNEFLNRLIVNYYETYAESSAKTYEHILEVLKNLGVSPADADSAAADLAEYAARQSSNPESRKMDVVISMKPTRSSGKAFDYIDSFLLRGSSLSGWLRSLFASYVRLPQDQREQIIFKENFDTIREAIQKKRRIYFLTENSRNGRHTVSPYALCSSKEELFNYLLAEEHSTPRSFRISRIYNVAILNEEAVLKHADVFAKMEEHGPQFAYHPQESEPIVVRLTEHGKTMYEKMYLHRPAYTKIEDDRYTFECSLNQAMQYFQRFGKHAVIVSPAKLHDDLATYYRSASDAYRKS